MSDWSTTITSVLVTVGGAWSITLKSSVLKLRAEKSPLVLTEPQLFLNLGHVHQEVIHCLQLLMGSMDAN